MHRISTIQICNYRSAKDVAVELHPFTPIVGYNNAGKSNLLSGLQWLLAPSKLNGTDFWDVTKPVSVEATVVGVNGDVLDLIGPVHRNKIEPFITDGVIRIRRECAKPELTVTNCKVSIRNTSVESDDDDAWSVNPTGIWSAIQRLFPTPIRIGAMEDSAEDSAKFKTTTTLGRLISEVAKPIIDEHASEFTDALAIFGKRLDAEGLDRPESLSRLDEEVSAATNDFFPGISVKVHVPTPDPAEFFKSSTLRVYEDRHGRDFTTLGHGSQRSIQMALIKVLADRSVSAVPGGGTRLLLIDEPELYLHPHAIEQIRDAFRDLSQNGYQVVFSTHSPIMVEPDDVPTSLMIVKSTQDGTTSRRTVEAAVERVFADYASQKHTLFSLTHSSQILFSEKALLIEGKTEQRLLPTLFHLIAGRRLRTARLAMVNIKGVDGVDKFFSVLKELDIPAKAVVDLDFAFRGGRRSGIIPEQDPDYLACLPVFRSVATRYGLELDHEGLPKKGGRFSAAEGFAFFAQEPRAREFIRALREKLLAKEIWLWDKGAIEAHLGISAKNESAWAAFKQRLDAENPENVIEDYATVDAFIQWIET